MPNFLMGSIALFLLLAAAGYGLTTLQARSIPWDCADWQAFAHEDRETAILESLAENRGKTLYCGIDQSDTFAKAETWAAGKDRNERDDTVYFGERGQFRGFIAAQEGWLTDGESGVTGVSIDRIFEFPREERRGRRSKVKRLEVNIGEGDEERVSSCGIGGDPSQSGQCPGGASSGGSQAAARQNYSDVANQSAADWQALAQEVAEQHCRAAGYPRVRNVWVDTRNLGFPSPTASFYAWAYARQGSLDVAYQKRAWRATCVKKVRGARR